MCRATISVLLFMLSITVSVHAVDPEYDWTCDPAFVTEGEIKLNVDSFPEEATAEHKAICIKLERENSVLFRTSLEKKMKVVLHPIEGTSNELNPFFRGNLVNGEIVFNGHRQFVSTGALKENLGDHIYKYKITVHILNEDDSPFLQNGQPLILDPHTAVHTRL
jgi:hypothetical protein